MKINYVIVSWIFLLSSLGTLALQLTPVVRTHRGPVRGAILQTVWNKQKYSAFKGIRYGKAPVGRLRFKPPVEATPWTKTLNAIREGSSCTQWGSQIDSMIGNEDCLFLNVYTPETKFQGNTASRAVMVWIHGGSYVGGNGDFSVYRPDFFMETNVVIVTLNYRLGAFGFLTLRHKDASGNAGLKDQNLALKWVQKNIKAFGGNPQRVTIFGNSAGSSSLDFHALSDMSTGLYKQSIAMSGASLATWTYVPPSQAQQNAISLGELLGYDTSNMDELLDSLLDASPSEIVTATTSLTQGPVPPFTPTSEEDIPGIDPFIKEAPIISFENGNVNEHPRIFGYTKDETIGFLKPDDDWEACMIYGKQTLWKLLTSLPNPTSREVKLLTGYLETLMQENDLNNTEILTDLLYEAPINLKRRLLYENSKSPIYYYVVSYETEYSYHKINGISVNGTAHGDDVGYIFDIEILKAPTDPKHRLNKFRKKMVKLWSNFAKYGNPTPNKTDPILDVVWKPSGRARWQLNINEKLTLHQNNNTPDVYVLANILRHVLPLTQQDNDEDNSKM